MLDLGCGRALTSIFLAREYGVRVTAADLWIKPTENWERIQAAGCADMVTPVFAEAHDLPFADGYFDAIVSIDAYHYFGTDDLYLSLPEPVPAAGRHDRHRGARPGRGSRRGPGAPAAVLGARVLELPLRPLVVAAVVTQRRGRR